MAHKKGAGSTKNGRNSNAKRLGIKKFGGEAVKAGNILIRQRGMQFCAGLNTKCGRDYTIFALKNGFVTFDYKNARKKIVNITDLKQNE